MNPKGFFGRLKPPVGLIPPVSILYMAEAFRLGGRKYGPFNWNERGKAAEAVTYYEAAMHRLFCWFCGEWLDPESGAPHLAHVMACCAIILDAHHTGQLIDNRPVCGSASSLIGDLVEIEQARQAPPPPYDEDLNNPATAA